MNELPIMPIRAKYADETTKGVNIDGAIEDIGGDVDTLKTTVDTIESNAVFKEDDKVKIYSNIADSDGNLRFISGDIALDANFKGTKEYAKWTLSGSHLMFVCMFKVTENFTASGTPCCWAELPQWLMDKIYPMENTNHIAVIDSLYGYIPNNLTASSGGIRPYLIKRQSINQLLVMIEQGNLEVDKYYRIVFDLVIA